MSDPRFRPQDFTEEPSGFGKAETLRWKAVAVIDLGDETAGMLTPARDRLISHRLGAAKLQHLHAYRIRQALRAKNYSLARYADEAGISYDRIAKILRGQAIMRLEDIAMADVILGSISETALADTAASVAVIEEASAAKKLQDEGIKAAKLEGRAEAIKKLTAPRR